LNSNKEVFAMRYWVIDNSSSMRINDGQKLVSNGGKTAPRSINCSRWDEVKECVEYHVQLAALLDIPTNFRLLNHPGSHVGTQQFSVACSGSNKSDIDMQNALRVMKNTRPGGCTPLTTHILDIYYEIRDMLPALRSTGQRVVIVLATDGLPTNERGVCNEGTKAEFVRAFKKLEELPVWVVIRLSTDEDNIVQFYDKLDQQLELDLDLLDDYSAEAKEVVSKNPWLNYSLPLHRLREMGYQQRIMDQIDERQLTKSELRDYCCLVFGGTGRVNDKELILADPSVDWKQFVKDLDRLQKHEPMQYDPIERKNRPWISTKKLERSYGKNKLKNWFKY